MISGAAQADVAVLVVDSITGEFESGFQDGGQTKEHAVLIRSLGVQQLIVAVNKMDASTWSQDRFNEITAQLIPFLKQTGFKEKNNLAYPRLWPFGREHHHTVRPRSPCLVLWTHFGRPYRSL
eukprot:GABV01000703.1.p2 GENE.GABV01000703.1~~GABV01000703.1.p2  ORF type:complete len:123 (+),score=19.41 GABV01000703.1:412-780(+)